MVALSVLISLMRTGVKEKDLVFSTVDQGTIEVSVSASGKVVPAFEEIINSPINTRILEVYKKGGDSVDVGTPILKLDLQSAETEYKKQLDEEQMKRYQLEQLEVNNSTYLSDLEMQVKVSEMKLNRMEVELRNERYLDSLGSGTTDRVHQAELNFKTGKLELEQLRQQLANERKVKAADLPKYTGLSQSECDAMLDAEGRDADCADESCLDGVCDGSCGVTPCCDAPGDEEDSMMSVGASMAAVAMARMPNEDLARKAALALILCEPKQYGDTVLALLEDEKPGESDDDSEVGKRAEVKTDTLVA